MRPEARESCGAPRRIAHKYKEPKITWGMVGLCWGIIMSIVGHALLVYMAGQLMGLWG